MITIDIETKSDKDIAKCGVYAYADSPYFDILLFAYSVDGQPVQVIDTANGEEIPENILAAIADENVIKRAFNVNFERVCLSKYLRENYSQYFQSYSIAEDTVGSYLDPKSWHCSMIHARTLGLPSSLAEVGSVLGIEQQKMTEGKALIKFFCTPYDTIDGVPQFHSQEDYPEKWEVFKAYNKRDVEAEMEIDKKLSRFPVPDFLWEEFYLDQEINDRGILVDMKLADAAIGLDAEAKEELTTEMQRLTGVENPNSVYQLLDWLESRGYKPDSLGKTQVKELIKTAKEPVKSVLEMRLQLSKSSVKKYTAMKQTACRDNRARGMFSFYGASRTGRWAGRNIQLQNLPQNHLEDLTEARELVKTGSFDDVQMIYDDVPDTLSQLIRTAFIPRQGMKFIVADFSAIEARVIAWLADEQWVLDAFANNKDLYCETASRMFGVPVEKHGINGELRQKGKQCTLSCSYGGAKGALIAMGAIDSGMKEDELQPLVIAWREANPNIVRFWHSLEQCAMKCIKEKTVTKTNRLTFSYEAGFLFIELPSGRRLAYAKPRIGENKFGGESITYMGINAQKKWDRLETFGGKIAENVCQAVARDLLMYSMQTLSHCFIVATVHDEIIIEASKDMSLDVVCQQIARTPKWAEGLILRADGYECEYYKKD